MGVYSMYSRVLNRSKSYLIAFVCALVMLFSVSFVETNSVRVFAEGAAEAAVDERAMNDLTSYVGQKMSANKYEASGGGHIAGDKILEQSGEGYALNESNFELLNSRAQSEVVSDIAMYSNRAVEDKESVTTETVQNWWKQLQSSNGVGSKFLNEILKNTKPDFVTANAIWQPFSGFFGTVMGLFAVIICSLLGLVILMDLGYMIIPPLRNFVTDNEEKGSMKFVKSKLISHAAIAAVQDAEESNSGKCALGTYFKKQCVMYIVFGIILMYLVQGQLFVLVGWILDLLRGFLKF